MSSIKLAIIGGGSMYTAGLLEALLSKSAGPLRGAEVTLMDVDASALERIQRYGEHLLGVTGADLTLSATTDRREALSAADFVLTTFRVGGFDTLAQDEEIPLRFGMLGQETTGVGGTFMALRTIPVMLEICRDMERLCPSAWLINYTNPTNFVADAVRRRSSIRCLSLCDNYVQLPPLFAFLLDVDEAEISFQSAGVNHLAWVLDLRVQGEPGYPRLRERLAEIDTSALGQPDPDVDLSRTFKPFIDRYYLPWAVELFETFGYFPCGPSYHRYYYAHDDMVCEMQQEDYVGLSKHYRWQSDWFFDKMNKAIASGRPPTPETRLGFYGHGELAVDVIAAIAAGAHQAFVVNTPNQGAIANLPFDAIVEVPALVDREGTQAFSLGNYPKELVGMVHAQILHQELVVESALSGDRNQVLVALLASPLVNSLKKARQCLDAMFEAQADWLPQFDAEVRK